METKCFKCPGFAKSAISKVGEIVISYGLVVITLSDAVKLYCISCSNTEKNFNLPKFEQKGQHTEKSEIYV